MSMSYFQISASNENNRYLLIHHSNTRGGKINTVVVVVESRSNLYSDKIVYLQVVWFTGYSGIIIEH